MRVCHSKMGVGMAVMGEKKSCANFSTLRRETLALTRPTRRDDDTTIVRSMAANAFTSSAARRVGLANGCFVKG